MKLLNIQKLEVVDFVDSAIPSYAYLSCAESAELQISSQSIHHDDKQQQTLSIPSIITGALKAAADRDIDFLWVDNICTEKSSAADSEADAGRRLQQSTVCFVFLDDLPASGTPFTWDIWARCKYWARAGALEALTLPPRVDFFDQGWNYRGSKAATEILSLLHGTTQLHSKTFSHGGMLPTEMSRSAKIESMSNDSTTGSDGEVSVKTTVARTGSNNISDAGRHAITPIAQSSAPESKSRLGHGADVRNITKLPWRHIKNGQSATIRCSRTQSPVRSGESLGDCVPEQQIISDWLFSPEPPEQSGLKRSRSGRELRNALHFQDDCSSTYTDSLSPSESGMSDSSSSSAGSSTDAESGDENESNSGDGSFAEYDFEADEEFSHHKQEFLDSVYVKVQFWIASVNYVEPPRNTLPSRKRIKIDDSLWSSLYLQEDEEDEELVVVSHVDGYFHLACPFYISDPNKHRQCLLQHHLRTIEELIKHLKQHHSEPLYCPICRQTFPKHADRDKHILRRTCTLRDATPVGGLTEHIKTKLVKRDRIYLSERRRWLRVWSTLFPGVEPSGSPYYEDGVERTVSLARDYWAKHGNEFVSQIRAGCRPPLQHLLDNRRHRTAASRSLLQGLLSRLHQEHMGSGRASQV